MVPQVELFLIVFLRELKTPKRHFEINLYLLHYKLKNLTLWFVNDPFNPIPTGHGRNQPIYERHVTKSGRNRVNICYSQEFKKDLRALFLELEIWSLMILHNSTIFESATSNIFIGCLEPLWFRCFQWIPWGFKEIIEITHGILQF